MALESIIEPLVKEYEDKDEDSRLHNIVSFAVSVLGEESFFDEKLNKFLITVGNLFGKGHIPYRYMFEYLAWRFPMVRKTGDYGGTVTASAMINELEVLWYAAGMLPLQADRESGERMLLLNPSDYRRLRPFSIGVTDPSRRHDQRAFRLYRRVTELHRGRKGPNWTSLLNIVLSFPPLQKKVKPTGLFSDIVGSNGKKTFDDYVLAKLTTYLTGQKAIVANSNGDVQNIKPLNGLELLMTSSIRNGHDRELSELFSEVRYRARKGGKNWGQYLGAAGAGNMVVAYHGIAINGRMVSGKWAEENDYSLLKAMAVGRVPVLYNGTGLVVSSKEDLHVFMGFKKPFRVLGKSPEQLIPAFRRAVVRYEKDKGKTPAQLLAAVLEDPDVVAKIGKTFLADVEAQWYINYFKGEVRDMLTGRRSLTYHGRRSRVLPQKNFHILRPESPHVDRSVSMLNRQMRWHHSKTGRTYYGFIDEVGAEARVTKYHKGTVVSREMINPAAGRPALNDPDVVAKPEKTSPAGIEARGHVNYFNPATDRPALPNLSLPQPTS